MQWEDIGIVISEKKHTDKYRIVDIFTKDHGRISAMTQISKTLSFSMFSEVHIEYYSKTSASIGFWKLKSETQNWIYLMNSQKHLIACQSICFILKKLLPHGVPHVRIFETVLYFLKYSSNFNSDEILTIYAYFEFIALLDIGFAVDLKDKQPTLWQSWKEGKIFEHKTMPSVLESLRHTGVIISANLTHIDNFFRNRIINRD